MDQTNSGSTPEQLEQRFAALEAALKDQENQNRVLVEAVANLSRLVEELMAETEPAVQSPSMSTPSRPASRATSAGVSRTPVSKSTTSIPRVNVAAISKTPRKEPVDEAPSTPSRPTSRAGVATPVSARLAQKKEPAPTPERAKSELRVPYFLKSSIIYPNDIEDKIAELKAKGKAEVNKSLELEHVYGYNARKSLGQNLFILPSGELLTFSAACGIVVDLNTNKQRICVKHDDDVTCMALHPNGTTVATGQTGKVPKIIVWDVNTFETIAELNTNSPKDMWPHPMGISNLAFSTDGELLVSIGQDGDHTLTVYDWKNRRHVACTKGHKDKVHTVAVNPVDNSVVLTAAKAIKFFALEGAEKLSKSSGAASKPSLGVTVKSGIFGSRPTSAAVRCVAFDKNGRAISGTQEGDLLIWEGNKIAHAIKAFDGPVFTLTSIPNGILAGGKDGKIQLYRFDGAAASADGATAAASSSGAGLTLETTWTVGDASSGVRAIAWTGAADAPVIVGLYNGDVWKLEGEERKSTLLGVNPSGEKEIWGIAFNTVSDTLIWAADDGVIGEYNYHTRTAVRKIVQKPSEMFRSVDVSTDGKLIVAGTFSGKMYVFNFEDGAEVYSGVVQYNAVAAEEIGKIRFSPDGRYIAAASHDQFIHVYNTADFKKVSTCRGHSSYITQIDWSADSKYLQSNCGAYEIMFWDAETGKQLKHTSEYRNIQWATWTCTLGWAVQGMWAEGQDGTDINGCAASHDRSFVVSCDDDGCVKVFNFPSVTEKAPGIVGRGHCSHVTSAAWSGNDEYFFTTGGGDLSILQWRLTDKA